MLFRSGISEVSAKRLKILPPGHWGAIALVVDLSAPSSRFVSTFAGSEDVSMLGVRAALSASTLVRESSNEGKNTITSFLDGIDSQNASLRARLHIPLINPTTNPKQHALCQLQHSANQYRQGMMLWCSSLHSKIHEQEIGRAHV